MEKYRYQFVTNNFNRRVIATTDAETLDEAIKDLNFGKFKVKQEFFGMAVVETEKWGMIGAKWEKI